MHYKMMKQLKLPLEFKAYEEPMSENIENLKSVLKIRISANTTQTTLQVNYVKK